MSVDREKLDEIISLLEETIKHKKAHARNLRAATITSRADTIATHWCTAYIDTNVEELETILADLKAL